MTVAAGGDARPHEPRRHGRGHARPARGRAERGLGLSRRTLFARRVWRVRRPRPEPEALARAVAHDSRGEAAPHRRGRRRPLFRSHGRPARVRRAPPASRWGRRRRARARSPSTIRCALGAIGATGTPGANVMAREADLVIGVGTRYSDFTTASKTAFQDPGVRFVNVNVCRARRLQARGAARGRRTPAPRLEALAEALGGLAGGRGLPRARRDASTASGTRRSSASTTSATAPLPSQGEVIGAVNDRGAARATSWCAPRAACPAICTSSGARATPRATTSSTATPAWATRWRARWASRWPPPTARSSPWSGDGSWLMMSSELVTALQEDVKLMVVLIDNGGFGSIGGLSESLGSGGLRHPLPRAGRGRPALRRRGSASISRPTRAAWAPT